MQWLKELSELSGERALYFLPGILNVTLPCVSYGDEFTKKSIKELARLVNAELWALVDKTSTASAALAESTAAAAGEATDKNLLEPVSATESLLAIDKLIESILKFLVTPSDSTSVLSTIESLKWLAHLVNKQPKLVKSSNIYTVQDTSLITNLTRVNN